MAFLYDDNELSPKGIKRTIPFAIASRRITHLVVFSNKKIKRLEGFGAIKSEYIKDIEYFKPGSAELAKAASEALKNEDVIVLKNHGVIATGETVKEAATLVEFVEEIAKTQFVTHVLNSIE